VAFADTQELIALLRHKLMTDAAISEIVGGRVLGAHPRTPDDRSTVYPLIILELEGGGASPTSGFQTATLFLYTYHRGSLGEAMRLYDLCHAALHHQTLRRDGVSSAGYALEQQRPESGWNEQARAHWCEGLWVVRAGRRS